MARRIMAAVVLIGVLAAAWIFARRNGRMNPSDFGLPQYQPFMGRKAIPAFTNCRYEWPAGIPAPNRVLIEAWGTNGWHDYYFDLQRQEIVGEVLMAGPIMMNKDQSRLLCYISPKSAQPNWVWKAKDGVRDVFGKWFKPKDYESIGIFDLKNNSVKPLGEIAQNHGYGTYFKNSPGGRYAYNQPSTMENTSMVALCDLDGETMATIDVAGHPVGWWDSTHILVSKNSDLVLFDVSAKSAAPLLTHDRFVELIQQNKWQIRYPSMDPICKWNGHEYRFYMVLDGYWIKIEKEGPSLRLLGHSTNFRYDPFARFDESENNYITNGDWDSRNASAVVMRGLKDGSERILVPSDRSNHRSNPFILGDTVIYERSNAIWKISLSTSNITRLFPPPL